MPPARQTHDNDDDGAEAATTDSSWQGGAGADGADDDDGDWLRSAQAHVDAKAKPPGSLGALEDWAVQCVGGVFVVVCV